MKKIYKELFFIPKDGKIRERVFIVRMALSVTVILLSLAAMSFTAYAYFTHTTTVSVATIQSANWDITVTAPEGVTQENGYYVLDNTESSDIKEYLFTVKDTETATATVGYVRVDIKTDVDNFASTQTFYSQCIGEILVDGEMKTVTERTIKVTVPANKKVILQFVGEWGTYAGTPIIDESVGIQPVFGSVAEETQQSAPQPSETQQSAPQAEEVQQDVEQPQDTSQDVSSENSNEESELQADLEQAE